MKRESDASTILRRMLERHERQIEPRRIIERPAQAFEDPASLRAMTDILRAAADAGAVDLVWDRDAPHLIGQVVMRDPERLYGFTGRQHPSEIVSTGLRALAQVETATAQATGLLSDLAATWSAGRRLLGIGPDAAQEAIALVRAVDAAFADLGVDVPLRTRSARLLGNSKSLERAMPAILAYLRHTGVIDGKTTVNEALEMLGLAKFAQPVLVAGPIEIDGADLSAWPYVGVPPEMVARLTVRGAVRSVLTVENLESFNRHSRSCRGSDDLVVYAGGFPSSAVIAVLRRLLEDRGISLHHWGDIDPGGVRIGRYLETALGVTVVPHLMDVALASSLGRPLDPGQAAPLLPSESAFYALAEYLRGSDAKWLEQEIVDPIPVS